MILANSVSAIKNTGTESVQYSALFCIELTLQIPLSVSREHLFMHGFYYH